ncbi:MAG: hypothetical protein VW405_12765, partial [Rhodospirillaceae bacterium]
TSPAALVFFFGVNDCADQQGVGRRVPFERSLAIARGMVAVGAGWLPTVWIGPPPVDDSRMPFTSAPTVVYDFKSDRIAKLNAAYARIAAELDVPYFDL